jgi:hypothetical protein
MCHLWPIIRCGTRPKKAYFKKTPTTHHPPPTTHHPPPPRTADEELQDCFMEAFQVFECDHCEKDFGEQSQLKEHVTTDHQMSFWKDCRICEEQFTSITYLKRHILKFHAQIIVEKIAISENKIEITYSHNTSQNSNPADTDYLKYENLYVNSPAANPINTIVANGFVTLNAITMKAVDDTSTNTIISDEFMDCMIEKGFVTHNTLVCPSGINTSINSNAISYELMECILQDIMQSEPNVAYYKI